MKYYNVRDSKGRFTKTINKEQLLNLLRTKTINITYEDVNNVIQCRDFTLNLSIISSYVGSGKSKLTDDNTVFAYDVWYEKFRCIKIDKIKNILN